MMKPIFQRAIPIIEKLEEAGYEAYFVGGAVRDLLIGREIADVDIATSATPIEMKAIFSKTVDVGIEHGTILILLKGEAYEVTTYRAESTYSDFRRPDEVRFIRHLKEDLQRRDFTMNSIAMDKNGELIDPFAGRESIQNREIKTVGSSEERFNEDALRMMRALRFKSQLGFLLEEGTYDALKKKAHLLQHVAVERKLVEFNKLLQGDYRVDALTLLQDSNLHHYLPMLSQKEKGLNQLVTYPLQSLSLLEIWVLLLKVFQLNEHEAKLGLKEWKMSSKDMKEILNLYQWFQKRLSTPFQATTIYQSGLSVAVSAEKLHQVYNHERVEYPDHLVEMYSKLSITSRKQLAVNGNDIITWSQQSAGPWLKELLAKVEEAIILGELQNNKEDIREWLFQWNQK